MGSISEIPKTSMPPDYLERVYAGVLGKIIGVYLGRPFEGWSHQKVMAELGPIKYYVHDRLDVPLVVTDDDVSGTFMFVRALEEHPESGADITAEDIGRTWLNNVIERRTIFWWGGNGISTEHTAYLNLKRGIPAPRSGSIQQNGKTVAEQIGAQIFIDGWALVSPGNPALAAKLARAAGSVSHDGESVYAAMLWAAMEAEAFNSKDRQHLLETGLSFIPRDCLIAKVIADIRGWAEQDPNDWLRTRQRIEDKYGYDKFCGMCHVVPNHGIMIMTLLYAKDFHEAMYMINTCGWDTDCNSGNVGCLFALMYGMKAFEGGPDWRGPVADRALISSADAGYATNNAARIAHDIWNMGRTLAGTKPIEPSQAQQFHFSLPGSVQGFESDTGRVEQTQKGLCIKVDGETDVTTPTFKPADLAKMKTYEFVGSPLVFPGQTIRAVVSTEEGDDDEGVSVQLKTDLGSGPVTNVAAAAGGQQVLEWEVPETTDGSPISRLGLHVSGKGTVYLRSLGWSGVPRMTLKHDGRGWVNGASTFHNAFGTGFYVGQDQGEGIVIYGNRDWTDYRVRVNILKVNLGQAGLAIRVQGLRRWYAVMFLKPGQATLVKAVDEKRMELVTVKFEWKLDEQYTIELEAKGDVIKARIGNDSILEAKDGSYSGGGVGLIAVDGSMGATDVKISPVS
ncbi:uncharacterized protein PV06_08753 [Exophiala oligosperma]|uniref:ADP-ribosylglycohydrolase n=1 Tax=Exophiala oligosperma TaxID=215243 RepID=A0A0D2BN56_9EURO|nr:uncharacterized protein PV06_08753 [Exophiala oligosperma]KIW38932.1 hypothetical protein PV06_08753 [Exophiala oligosperma]